MSAFIRLFLLVLMSAVLWGCSDSSDKHSPPLPPPEPEPLVPSALVSGPITNGSRGFPATPAIVDLDGAGYVEEEFFVEGEARAFDPDGEWGIDGIWPVTEASTADYKTRILVRRPSDPAQFSGVVVVEWFNVTSAVDLDVDFNFLNGEILRSGHAWVGVTAQAISIESIGDGPLGPDVLGLMAWDSARYESLFHPGDAYSYDIYSQVGATLKAPKGDDPLGGLKAEVLIADGESQSAFRMLTYVNAIHSESLVYDGFLIHSRNGSGAPLNETVDVPAPAQLRDDLKAPVLQFVTETDLFGIGEGDFSFPRARQPDSDSVRTWEVAGTSHSDASSLAALSEQGARQYDSFYDLSPVLGLVNSAPQYMAMHAALNALVSWVRDGQAPSTAPPIETRDEEIVVDRYGNALGGVRLPHSEAPIATLSGDGPILYAGLTTPFDQATLDALYPSAADYIEAVETSAQAAVEAGFLLQLDADILIAEAKANPPVQ
ncbi:hypothetical protein H2508_08985 [Parahaliea sp. F7430]|uniref:Alpha/beta hydrolase domain-containing protein n=1 Tax=Sediminihaliea albiluteola TaxID=2758564 RepID=A0A7W2YJ68_9GAMM|nr:alpha/beta hydrolase domain-containing protein [Sediminihaliea albiluteola]MBA6413241.1 hypothetical protein [Sediminihaliea albiluteola]